MQAAKTPAARLFGTLVPPTVALAALFDWLTPEASLLLTRILEKDGTRP